ncbi:hypothetical protein J1605_001982 [Eschrichtius robustus]|uniref:Uncharacterized protein n=1 Tax=Eschrichtius robustus TaxID=9764 RepID=A0AB34GPV1_ESCRO|nr:hypothetical protein J1605_010448 [Eschrichtius robustus]KAJ8796911.1 hypothetical protein J1605_001982 [Eschrichtius robustus]
MRPAGVPGESGYLADSPTQEPLVHLPALCQLRGWAESRCLRQRADQTERPQAAPAPATKEDLAVEQPVSLRWPQAPGRTEQTPSSASPGAAPSALPSTISL